MFRYERPQAGRLRQFHQIGVECLGVSSARSDVEVIALAWDLLTSLGLQGLELQINSLGTIADRINYRTQLVSWLNQRVDQLDLDSQQRLDTNPYAFLIAKILLPKNYCWMPLIFSTHFQRKVPLVSLRF